MARAALANLLTAAALGGCAAATVTPYVGATTNAEVTQGPGVVQPPGAPSELHEWVDDSLGDPVFAHFEWTPPPGPIGGYYFWIKGVYTSDVTAPPAICGPTWTKLPASKSTYTMVGISSDAPDAYICAFNDAGTSATVHFTADTP